MEIWQPLKAAASPSLPLQSLSLTPNSFFLAAIEDLCSSPSHQRRGDYSLLPCGGLSSLQRLASHLLSVLISLWDKHKLSPFLVAHFLLFLPHSTKVRARKQDQCSYRNWGEGLCLSELLKEILVCSLAFAQKVVWLFTEQSVNMVFNHDNLCTMHPTLVDSCFK